MKTSKFFPSLSSAKNFAALAAVAGVLGAAPHAFAYPTTSPSAIAAVRLKYRPPAGWIRHYLGDDRYKIAGGVWKYVSTTTDQYYHRPDSPFMLSQPAGIVIGFASAEEAEEAGYLPGPSVNAIVLPAGGSGNNGTNALRNGAVDPAVGTRIVLADGRSTAILPRGWTHVVMRSQNHQTGAGAVSFQGDVLAPPNSRAGIVFGFINVPGNVNVEPFLSPARIEQLRARLQQRAGQDANFAKSLEGAQLGNGTLGGLRGLTVVPGKNANLPEGMAARMTMVGRGSKLYMMSAQLAADDRSYGLVVNSFVPR